MKFVIIAAGKYTNWMSSIYHDVLDYDNVYFYQDKRDMLSWINRIMLRICESKRINHYIRINDLRRWYKKFDLSNIAQKNDQLYVLIYVGVTIGWEQNFLKLLRTKYPKIHIALCFTGLISLYEPLLKEKGISVNDLKKWYDTIITFDNGDIKKYGLQKSRPIYSFYKPVEYFAGENYDLCYVGHCKDRLTLLYELYDRFEAAGMRCRFFISGVNKEKRIKRKGITYMKKWMPYEKSRSLSYHSKCILELLQVGQTNSTIRYKEALSFNKLFLTNNEHIDCDEYYDAERIKILRNDASDVEFVKNTGVLRNKWKDNPFSPVKRLAEIEQSIINRKEKP